MKATFYVHSRNATRVTRAERIQLSIFHSLRRNTDSAKSLWSSS